MSTLEPKLSKTDEDTTAESSNQTGLTVHFLRERLGAELKLQSYNSQAAWVII